MFMKNYFLLFLLINLSLLASCEKSEQNIRNYSKGIFIVNEGTFGSSNGSISWYNPDEMHVTNNIFENSNGRPVGDVVQSFGIAGAYGFIVVNNSQKVEIVNLRDFSTKGVIGGLSYPRFFVANETHGFISNGNMEGTVIVVDLIGFEKIAEIPVGYGPEQMAIAGDFLYVANSGGWSYDNTVSVIDVNTKQLVKTIEVGDIPFALQKDNQDNLWVLSRGKVVYDFDTWEIIEETDSRLVKINTVSNAVISNTVVGETGDFSWPTSLSVSGDGSTLFLNDSGSIYSVNASEEAVSIVPVMTGSFQSFAVNPSDQ
jgi:YVTN family beta-propeller protein